MIPRRIHLRNFLSYRECTVDFTGLHLAVLSGKNGEGKSALLDGITWALWGQARGKVLDDAIYQGADEMLAEFEFLVNNDTFVVLRKRTRSKSSSVTLYQLREDGQRTTRTGGVARETQLEINRLLRMDYDTFCNSAFLAQGRSDQFTRQGPSERKEIFRTILGLERYQEYADEARRRRGDSQRTLEITRRTNESDATEVERLPAIAAAVTTASSERAVLEARIEELAKEQGEAQQAAGEFAARKRELEGATSRAAAAQVAVVTTRNRVADLSRALTEASETLCHAPAIEAEYQRLQDLQHQESQWNDRLRQSAACREELNTARSTIDQEKVRLESEQDLLREQIATIQPRLARLPELRQRELALAAQAKALEADLAEALRLEGEASDCGRVEAQATAQAQAAMERATRLKEHALMLGDSPVCPICTQRLSPADAKRVLDENAAERKALGDDWRKANARAVAAREQAAAAAERAAEIRKSAASRDAALATESREVNSLLSVALENEKLLPGIQARLDELVATLEAQSYAVEARALAEAASSRLIEIGYDEAAHRAVSEAVRGLAGAAGRFMTLGQVRERAAALQEQLTDAETAQMAAVAQSEEAIAALEAARAAVDAIEDVGPRLAEITRVLSDQRRLLEELAHNLGALESERTRLTALNAKLEANRDTERTLTEEVDVFTSLTEAFGPSGVQALLMDQALPDLQRDANAMLDRMTGGRIQVAFTTQRPKKDGGVIETLDIIISDDLGMRPYEMYSGGERFRVDFAIRIGLARLLAARAGAALPTLIIDEGFGSQDSEGIDRLMEAIYTIRDDFRLVLVVTHIDEMKERFNQRIEITKDPVRGSTATVI